MKYIIVILLSIISFGAKAQESQPLKSDQLETLKVHEDTLYMLGQAVIKDSIDNRRFLSCRQFIKTLTSALKTPNSFQYPFARIETMSIQYPQDSSFRVFTWQLYVDKDTYRYYGAIQMNTSELTLLPLIDRSQDMSSRGLEQAVLDNTNWYGSLCYKIMDVDGPDGRYYLFFGYDGFEFFRKRKLIDVLHFKDGKAIFGAPVFVDEKDGQEITLNRFYMEYSSDTRIGLNYDEELGKIVFDHLILMNGQYGEGPVYVTDGSYDGYELMPDGRWKKQHKLFKLIMDEPPMLPSTTTTRSQRKDLFGN